MILFSWAPVQAEGGEGVRSYAESMVAVPAGVAAAVVIVDAIHSFLSTSQNKGGHTSVIKHMMMFISYILTQENEDLALFYIVNADFSSSFRSVWHSYCVWHLILII